MMITRRMLAAFTAVPAVAVVRPALALAEEKSPIRHRVAMQMNSSDADSIGRMLNNMQNIYDHYDRQKELVAVRIVSFGPGLSMVREDISPVKGRLAMAKQNYPTLTYAACANTKRNLEKTEGKEIALVSLAEIVPSGVVELVELQEKGWSYLRP